MNPSETRVARARLYALLSSLVARGPTPSALAVARELPALAELTSSDPETLASGHHAALSLASASACLSPDGLAGGPEPDDLGAVLATLAALDARGDASDDVAALLDRTLSWLPIFALCVRTVREPAWSAVVDLSLELCAGHRASIDRPRVPVEPSASPIDLDAPETSLRSIAASLCRPAVSAWMPSGPEISRLAEAVDLPGGFGDRSDRLTGLFYAATDAGRLPALCDTLHAVLLAWATDLRAFEDDLRIPLSSWSQRADATAGTIVRVGRSASA